MHLACRLLSVRVLREAVSCKQQHVSRSMSGRDDCLPMWPREPQEASFPCILRLSVLRRAATSDFLNNNPQAFRPSFTAQRKGSTR